MLSRLAAAFLIGFVLLDVASTRCALAQIRANRAGWQQVNPASTAARGLLPPPSPPGDRVIRTSGEAPAPPTLPNGHGQIWQEYDISRYTRRHPKEAKPQQTIIDWILRETGTELWFSEPLGILSADRNTLRVYHSGEIQQVVDSIVQRFINPSTESHAFGVRMVTLSHPNWRTKALPRMQQVMVQSPGVEAWLLSREDAAIVIAELRKRSDFREHNSPNLLIGNGDTHYVSRIRPVAYTRSVRPTQVVAYGIQPTQQLDLGQVEQGFNLKLSPLMSLDATHADAVIKIDSHQVENMKKVLVNAPTIQNARQMTQVEVPQTSSWRLHERFRWPANQVLLISCGVVASPGPDGNRNGLGLPKLLPGAPRADALLFVDAKGRSADWMTDRDGRACALEADQNYRGRY